MEFDEAVAEVTAPGQLYAISDALVRGRQMKVFDNTPSSIADLFGLAAINGEKEFIVYGDQRQSFAEMYSQVQSVAGALVHQLDIARGDRVGIALRNLPEWIAIYGAIVTAGAVVVPLNSWWSGQELSYAIADCGAKVVFVDQERYERLAQVPDLAPVTLIGVRTDAKLPIRRFVDLLSAEPIASVSVDLDDDATILYTSGTTGKPKGAVSSHRSVLSAIMAYGARNEVYGRLNPPTHPPRYPPAFILVVPLFHVTGCIPVMLGSLLSGAKLVLMHHWNPEDALELIERERITNFVGVPTMSWDLLESERFLDTDTSSLLSIGGGGSSVPRALVDRLGATFTSASAGFGYGMTETNAYGPQIAGKDLQRHPTSAGRTLPVLSVRVISPSGDRLGPSEVGEICFFGVTLANRYWNNPRATQETFPDGWLRSGDLGYLDDDGYVYVVDRLKDMVIRGGENIYCVEVEAAIYEHPSVYEVAVFGVPHERLGEELAAVVMVRPGSELTQEQLREFLRSSLASYKIPTHIRIVDEPLPRGATGKILKRDLKVQLASGGI